VGVGGVARSIRSAYIGDDNGKAKTIFGKPYPTGVITPNNMTSDTAPAPYIVASSSVWSSTSYPAFKAFQDASYPAASVSGSTPNEYVKSPDYYLEIDLGETRYANRGRFKNWDNNSTDRCFPREFKIFGSNDPVAWNDAIASSNWDLLTTITDYVQNTALHGWCDYFDIVSPNYYRYYRLVVTRVWWQGRTSSCVCFGQLELSAL
jgi:hypothetical protein